MTLLHLEGIALIGVAGCLAYPVPLALARATWPARSPRAALILWQAIGWAGGISILTAGLTLAVASLDSHWWPGAIALAHSWPSGVVGWFGLALAAGLGAWLMLVALTSALRLTAARRAHRRRLDLIGEVRSSVQVIEHPQAVAYCLPGLRPRIVLTRGVLSGLSDAELAAVLGHEQAHARGRHDLVIQPFIAWSRTFPFLRPARQSVAAVALLIEMLADDAALAVSRPADLAAALRRISDGRIRHTDVLHRPGAADWSRQLTVRLARLEAGSAPHALVRPGRVAPGSVVTAMVYCAALVIVTAPPALLVLS